MQRPDLLMTNPGAWCFAVEYTRQHRAAVDSREPRHVQGPAMGTRPSFAALLAMTCMAAFAQEPPREASVTTEQVKPGLFVLRSAGGTQVSGNVLAVLGDAGTLIIDSGYPQFVPKYREAIATLHG